MASPETDEALQKQIRQQDVVAELGQRALETDDLDGLMHDAALAVAETLDNEYAKVLELLPGDDAVLLRQGVGWRDGLVGSATVPTDLDSQAGYTLLSEEPVIVDDLRTEDRFSGPELLTSHDVVSGISVVVGSVAEPWGVLGTHTTERREFTDHDATFVQNVANVLAAAISRRRNERELEEQRERYRRLLETSPAAIAILDADGRVAYANDAAADLAAVDRPDDLVDRRAIEFVHPEDRAEIADRMHRVIAEREATPPRETKFVTADGERRCMTVTTAPVTYRGAPAGQVVLNDVTEQVERKRKLEEVIAELEESNDRLEQFAYAASHDLQEPLRMVSNYLRLIEDRYGDDLDEDAEEFLEYAVDGADRMCEMIDGLLEYSRVDTRGDPFEPVDLNAVVENALDDLQVTVDESDAAVETERLPRVTGDAGQLRQVFQNLLSNAITYSGDEPPRIRVDAERRGRERVVSVHDEGIGIDPEDHDRIFTVFDRLHSREEYEGTGIGLALCERIVERHDGEIWVESEPGEGATFSFTLPAASDRE